MKTIITAAELIASLELTKNAANEFKFLKGTEEVTKELYKQLDDLRNMQHSPNAALARDMTRKANNGNTPRIKVTIAPNGDLTMDIDENLTVDILNVLSDNSSVLVNIGITIFGLMKTFFGTMKSMGRSIERVMTR